MMRRRMSTLHRPFRRGRACSANLGTRVPQSSRQPDATALPELSIGHTGQGWKVKAAKSESVRPQAATVRLSLSRSLPAPEFHETTSRPFRTQAGHCERCSSTEQLGSADRPLNASLGPRRHSGSFDETLLAPGHGTGKRKDSYSENGLRSIRRGVNIE